MPEFCTCGSIIFNGQCSNKNCAVKVAAKAMDSKAERPAKKEAKNPRTRRASKCITYNLYEGKEEDID